MFGHIEVTRLLLLFYCSHSVCVWYMVQLILCKDNARREENEMNVFISYPEPLLILCKDNARREENEMNVFISYPEL